MWLPNKLETLYNHLINNKDVSLVFSNAYITDENLNITKNTLWSSIRFSKKMIPILKTNEAYKYLIRRNYATGATIAFKSNLLKYIYPIPKNFVHDHYITFIASMVSNIEPIDECLIYYRQHETQSIGVKNSNYVNTIIRLVFKKRIPSYKNNDTLNIILKKDELSKEQKNYIKYYLKHSFARDNIYNAKFPKNILLSKKEFRKYFKYPNALINAIRDILKL